MRRPSPSELLRELPEGAADLVRRVLAEAEALGLCVHLVGGPVRDLLMGRPLRDVDLLVAGEGGVGAAELAAGLAAPELQVTVHERFGTVTLRGEKAEIDLATVRRERYAHDGALPEVFPGTLEEDLKRRDFTVNALALPLSAAARARHPGVVDVEGGLADLERKQLRILHRRSFHDDPTRALRAARLAPRLGFSLSRDSRAALRGALRDGAFSRVSGERLRREMMKLFADAAIGLDPPRALRLLSDWHVLAALEPGLRLDPTSTPPLRRLGRSVAARPWAAPRWRPWQSGLALWLAPLPAGMRRAALRRFALRGERAQRVADFAKARDQWLRALSRARGRGAIDAVLTGIDEERLHALHASAPPPLRRRIARWAAEDRVRRPPVSGADLVEIGLSGPDVGRALARIRLAWLDGSVGSRDDALLLARELSRRRGSRAVARKKR